MKLEEGKVKIYPDKLVEIIRGLESYYTVIRDSFDPAHFEKFCGATSAAIEIERLAQEALSLKPPPFFSPLADKSIKAFRHVKRGAELYKEASDRFTRGVPGVIGILHRSADEFKFGSEKINKAMQEIPKLRSQLE